MAQPRNVVLITSDSVRADHCFTSFAGHRTTPTLDRFRANGVSFDNAIAPGPRTPSSIPAMLTGRPMPLSPVAGRDHQFRRIEAAITRHPTVPERLSRLGYSTAAISANPYTTRHTGFDSIFDEFHDIGAYRKSRLQNRLPSATARTLVSLLRQYWYDMHWFCRWPNRYDSIVEVIDGLEAPYFVWIFLLDTHNPYLPPRTDRVESTTLGMYRGLLRANQFQTSSNDQSTYRSDLSDGTERSIRRAYRDAIRSVDRFVGTLWDDLRADDPLLVFNSDHGEAFNEHGTYGHQSALYEENLHVPFVVHNTDTRARIDAPVSLRQVPDAIVEHVRTGRPFTDGGPATDHVCSHDETGAVAVRGRRWKYIHGGGGEELYDLGVDPGERRNLAESRPETVRRMRESMASYRTECPADDGVPTPEGVDESVADRLDSLGYVG